MGAADRNLTAHKYRMPFRNHRAPTAESQSQRHAFLPRLIRQPPVNLSAERVFCSTVQA